MHLWVYFPTLPTNKMVSHTPQPIHLPALPEDGTVDGHKPQSHPRRWWQDVTASEVDMLLLSLALKLLLFPS